MSSVVEAIFAGIATVMLIGLVYAVKAVALGVNKAKEKAGVLKEELDKIEQLIAQLSYSEDPQAGKIETICFHLSQADEKLFYDIPHKYVKRLKTKLEKIIKEIPDTETSYGRQYAERQFWIGNQLVFSWQNQVKI